MLFPYYPARGVALGLFFGLAGTVAGGGGGGERRGGERPLPSVAHGSKVRRWWKTGVLYVRRVRRRARLLRVGGAGLRVLLHWGLVVPQVLFSFQPPRVVALGLFFGLLGGEAVIRAKVLLPRRNLIPLSLLLRHL